MPDLMQEPNKVHDNCNYFWILIYIRTIMKHNLFQYYLLKSLVRLQKPENYCRKKRIQKPSKSKYQLHQTFLKLECQPSSYIKVLKIINDLDFKLPF